MKADLLLAEISEFRRAAGMAESTFGGLCFLDEAFVISRRRD